MAIRRNGNKWQVDVTYQGRRGPRLSASNEQEARRIEAAMLVNLKAGLPTFLITKAFAKPRIGTLAELVEATRMQRWAASKAEQTAIFNATSWCTMLGNDFAVADLKPDLIAQVCDEWASGGSSSGTINRKLE